MAKGDKIQPSDDLVRETILEYLYDAYDNPRGMESHKVKVNEVYSALKKKGIERKYVIKNLIYLIKTNWVIEEIEKVQFNTGKRIVSNKKKTYSLSKEGIDFFEESSKFQKNSRFAGIDISNVKDSIIILGNNNIVRNEYKELSKQLDKLGNQIRINSKVSDDEKIDYQSEIDTIKAQLAKSNPSKNIIKRSWDSLKSLATLNGVADLYTKIQPLIISLLGKLVGV